MKILPRSEELVLLAILHLRDDAYGVTIRRYLAQVTGQNLSISSVYVPLDRLTDKGYARAFDKPSTEARDGRRRRYFSVTQKGLKALAEIERVQKIMWAGYYQLALG